MARKNNICTSLDSDGKSDHLSCLDEEQTRIRQSNLERKRRAAVIRESRIEDRPQDPLLYPSLGGGLFINRGINPLSGQAVRELHDEIRAERSHYYAWVKQPNGKRKRKKRKTKPLKQLTLTFRRDFAMAFMACEGTEFQYLLLQELNEVILPEIIEDFEARTNLEVVSVHIHSEEGNLHLHVAFSKVSENYELLWRNREVGRHDLRLLNFSHTGTLRLIRGGYIDETIGEKARIDLADRMRNSGEEPIDWVLSKYLDDYCEDIFSRSGLQPIYEQAREEYAKGLELRMAQKPKALKRELERMKNRVSEVEDRAFSRESELERELETLRAQNGALEAENARLKNSKPHVEKEKKAHPESSFYQRVRRVLPDRLRGHEYEDVSELTLAADVLGETRASLFLVGLATDKSVNLTQQERGFLSWYGSSQPVGVKKEPQKPLSFYERVKVRLPVGLVQSIEDPYDLLNLVEDIGEPEGGLLLQKIIDDKCIELTNDEQETLRSYCLGPFKLIHC